MLSKTAVGALRRDLEAAGVFNHHTGKTTFKLVLFAAIGVGLVAVSHMVPWWGAVLIAPVAGLFCAGAAMIGHEGTHRSFAKTPLANDLVGHFAFSLLGGLGVEHWRNKHNRLHHGFPNVEHVDDDIDLWPMATSSAVYASSSAPRRLFQRHLQGWAFWPLSFGFLVSVMRLQSISYVIGEIRAGRAKRATWLDAICLAAHYGLWLGLGSVLVGPVAAIAVYFLVWCFTGLYLALIFTPAHMGLPIYADKRRGWEHQIDTTRNLAMPAWFAVFVCGLDYQIEHHLFPKIPHQNLPLAADITRRWCEANGLVHRTHGFGRGIADVTRFMRDAWNIDPVTGEADPTGQPEDQSEAFALAG